MANKIKKTVTKRGYLGSMSCDSFARKVSEISLSSTTSMFTMQDVFDLSNEYLEKTYKSLTAKIKKTIVVTYYTVEYASESWSGEAEFTLYLNVLCEETDEDYAKRMKGLKEARDKRKKKENEEAEAKRQQDLKLYRELKQKYGEIE